MLIGSADCIGTGASTTYGVTRTLLYLPKSFSGCVERKDEEGDVDRLLLFLCECLNLLDFLLPLKDSEEADMEVDEEVDDRWLLFFFDLWLLLDCSLRDSLACDV